MIKRLPGLFFFNQRNPVNTIDTGSDFFEYFSYLFCKKYVIIQVKINIVFSVTTKYKKFKQGAKGQTIKRKE